MRDATDHDDFYTRFEDIEAIEKYIGNRFDRKVVLCNCDDPFESSFFQYLVLNFIKLGLKRLIAISYHPSPIVGKYYPLPDYTKIINCRTCCWQINDVNDDVEFELDRCSMVKKLIDHRDNHFQLLSGDGDFRSYECMSFMNEADIAMTAPPTGLLKEYVKLLLDCRKKILLLGSLQNIQQKLAGFLAQKQITLLTPTPEKQAEKRDDKALGDVKFLPPHDAAWVTNMEF